MKLVQLGQWNRWIFMEPWSFSSDPVIFASSVNVSGNISAAECHVKSPAARTKRGQVTSLITFTWSVYDMRFTSEAGGDDGEVTGRKAARPLTTVHDCVSTFVSVTLNMIKESSGHFQMCLWQQKQVFWPSCDLFLTLSRCLNITRSYTQHGHNKSSKSNWMKCKFATKRNVKFQHIHGLQKSTMPQI